jgi:hypothetical protein
MLIQLRNRSNLDDGCDDVGVAMLLMTVILLFHRASHLCGVFFSDGSVVAISRLLYRPGFTHLANC